MGNKKNMPFVSIIMSVYNRENTLRNSIDSIIGQTYKNWEFIICDDCSTDGSSAILKEYEALDSRIKVFRNQSNLKLAASLNKCIRISKGKYIARMDDDDISFPNRIRKEVNFLERNQDIAAVGSSAIIFNGEKNIGIREVKKFPDTNDLLYGPCFIHPSIMIRKKVMDDLSGYTVSKDMQRGQDWDLWFRFYAKGYNGYNIQEPLLTYFDNSIAYNKRRKFSTSISYARIALKGYKILGVHRWKYIIAFKPILSYVIPFRLKRLKRN